MKANNKLMALAILLLAVIALPACTSEDGPRQDDDTNGKIDVSFLKSLARGETAITLDADTVVWYTKDFNPIGDYQPDTLENGWIENRYMPIDGWMWPAYSNITIADSKVWHKVNLRHESHNFSLVYEPWRIYCRMTGYNKQICVICPFEFDEENMTVTIYGDKYDIELADDTGLAISQTVVSVEPNLTDEQCYKNGLKTELRYKKGVKEEFDPEQIVCFSSNKEAKIAMVRMMREYFGDIINLDDYSSENVYLTSGVDKYPVINLEQLEYDLLNDLYEFDSWYKYNAR